MYVLNNRYTLKLSPSAHVVVNFPTHNIVNNSLCILLEIFSI